MNTHGPNNRRSGIEETPYVPPIYDDNPETEVSRRWRIPVALVGLAGFIAGVFIWGSLAMAMLDGVQSFTEDSEATANGNGSRAEATPTVAVSASSIDCDALAAQESMSPGEQALFDEACAQPAAAEGGDEAAEEPAEAPPAEAAPPEQQAAPPEPQGPANRANCNQIRGTQYLSPEERTWFLTNCVNR